MFIFYVVLAGQDTVTDAVRATTCTRKFNATSLQTKSTKKEGPFENMGFNGKNFKSLDEKKLKYTSSFDQTTL